MSVTSIHNPKINELSYDIICENFIKKENSYWNVTTVIQELHNFNIDTTNKTVSEVLKETHLKEQEIFNKYYLVHNNFTVERFRKTEYYYNILCIKNHLVFLALWLYEYRFDDLPEPLRTLTAFSSSNIKFSN